MELLRARGYRFRTQPSNDPEEPVSGIGPRDLALHHARNKGAAVAARNPHGIVLAADTLVALGPEPFGKPADLHEAAAMLRRLSGQTHEVHTAVWIEAPEGSVGFVETTRVRFFELTDAAIADYLARINPLDKAGAYAAQECAERIIAAIEGSFTNVVGLPMERVETTLAELGIRPENPGTA